MSDPVKLELFEFQNLLVSGNPTFQGWGGGPRQPGWPPNRPTRLAAQHSEVEAAARLAQWR